MSKKNVYIIGGVIVLAIVVILVVVSRRKQPSLTPAQVATEQAVARAKATAAKMQSIAQNDSDFDGLSNSDEVQIYHTNPNNPDTDGDGLLDGDEIKIYHTNPLKADTDGDGYSDGYLVRRGYSPLTPNKLDTQMPIGEKKLASAPSLSAYNNIQITSAELADAGFTGVKKLVPTTVRYAPPQYYFTVSQSVAGWGNASNLVSILVLPTDDKNWVYNNGKMEVKDEAGRTQINLTTPGYYISIDGPDKNKEAALAAILSKLF